MTNLLILLIAAAVQQPAPASSDKIAALQAEAKLLGEAWTRCAAEKAVEASKSEADDKAAAEIGLKACSDHEAKIAGSAGAYTEARGNPAPPEQLKAFVDAHRAALAEQIVRVVGKARAGGATGIKVERAGQ